MEQYLIQSAEEMLQKLFVDAIKDFPISPKSGNILFSADGLFCPKYTGSDIERGETLTFRYMEYLKETEKRGIIPFSSCDYIYSPPKAGCEEGYLPRTSYNIPPALGIEGINEKICSAFIKRDRFHCINVIIGDDRTDSFEILKEKLLDQFLQRDYQIHSGTLILPTEEAPNGYVDLSVIKTKKIEAGLEMLLTDSMTGSNIEYLKDWFNELSKRYQQQYSKR